MFNASVRVPRKKRGLVIGHDDAITPANTGLTPQQNQVLNLQRTVGNRAVVQMTSASIQRLPDSVAFIADAGKPKKKSTRYKALLAALDAYQNYITTKPIGSTGPTVKNNIGAGLDLLESVRTNLLPLKTKIEGKGLGTLPGTKKKRGAMLALDSKIQEERAKLIVLQAQYATGKPFISGVPTIAEAGSVNFQSGPISLKTGSKVGANRGGSAEVTEYSQGGIDGFFKANKTEFTFKNEDDKDTAQQAAYGKMALMNAESRQLQEEIIVLKKEISEGKDDNGVLDPTALATKQQRLLVAQARVDQLAIDAEAVQMEYNAKENEFNLGVQDVGIDPNDSRMANRDVAMAMIDQLLGANVIAKAQFAIQEDPTVPNGIPGSFMEKAQGRQLDRLIKDPGGFKEDDAALMRQLSRLQLIDILCFQVDRNLSNVFVQRDGNGNVTGITGIDNDFSLGTSTDFSRHVQQLPGLSKYVDADLAQRIIDLNPTVLGNLMVGLLSTAEIDALKTRLAKLQTELRKMKEKKQLLEPGQWTMAVAQDLFKEDKSYFAEAKRQKDW